MTLEFKDDASDIYQLKEHLWSGGLETLQDILELDAKHDTDFGERLYQHLEEVFMYDGETPDITTINDYLWFERDSIYEAIGLNENGEIPSIVDEARAENKSWTVTVSDLKEAKIFDENFIKYVIDYVTTDEDEDGNLIYDDKEPCSIDFEELENNSEEVTEEQIEFLENL